MILETAVKVNPFAKTEPVASFRISPHKITRILSLFVCGLIVMGSIAQYLRFSLGEEFMRQKHLWWLIDKFDLDGEFNVPNLYQTLTLLVCGLLLAMIARASNNSAKRFERHWWGLAAIFCYLACDEGVEIHEMTIKPLREIFGTSGYFYYAWVMVAVILAPIFLATYLQFLLHLPSKFRWLFITAGTVFVSGAVGMEMVGGHLRKIYGPESVQYITETIIEESLEMTGILIFIYALLSYLSQHVKEFHLQFTQQRSH